MALEQPRYCGSSVTKLVFDYESSSLTAGAPIGKVSKVCVSPAKAIEPDRLEFPSPPAFDPVPFLDPQTAEVHDL